MIELLRKRNPGLPFYTVFDPAFKPLGRVVQGVDTKPYVDACQSLALPPESKYMPSLPDLEDVRGYSHLRRRLFGESGMQLGVCWGHNTALNALEYHRASEFNIAVTDMVLLLADQRDMDGFELSTDKVSAFFVPKGTLIEVYATSMHYCPCQTSDAGFIAVVALPRSTNHDLTGIPDDEGENRLLMAKNKWLICHPDAASLVQQGAYPGIHGINYVIRY